MTPNNANADYMSSQTAQFTETQPGEVMEFVSTTESNAISEGLPQLELNKFFERPTLIQTITWGSGGVSSGRFYPWTDFLSNAYIENKLKNYALFRGDLHIKLVVSANPFTYGAALLSYTPVYQYVTDSVAEATGALQNSQKPHIWVWPQNNAGGELVLPFFWKSPYVNILTTAETDKLGELFLEEVIGLDTANDVAIPTLTIQVYAWCTNVKLAAPTTQLVLQAGVESEYKQGPVERIATTVAGISTALTAVPVLEPFAMATTMAATTLASIASLFGWSKTVLIQGAHAFRPLFYHGFTSSDIGNAMDKLALDQKTELSVDPRIVNLSGQDELSLSYLLQKEAYTCNSNWLSSDSVGDQLFEFPVWPGIMRSTDNTTYYTVQATPMAYFANMFSYWRGDIVFRFRLVASQYHRGRIKITYEPKGEVGASDYSNIALTKIVDITEENDITFVVPYSQEQPWLNMSFDPTDSLSIGYQYDKTGSASHVNSYTNGTIRVQVLTTLSSPQATPSCHIIAYVRGGENLEVAVPQMDDQVYKNTTHLDLQSGIESFSDILTGQSYQHRYKVNMGEQIASLRQVLCRSTLSQFLTPFQSALNCTMGFCNVRMTRTPAPPGYDTGAPLYSEKIVAPGTNARFTFSFMHPINWVAPCFAAMRGGIQVNFAFSNGQNHRMDLARITRVQTLISANDAKLVGSHINLISGIDQNTSAVTVHSAVMGNGASGTAMTNIENCPVLSAELPDQHQYLFNVTRQEDWLRGTSTDDSNRHTYLVDAKGYIASDTYKAVSLEKYMNIAPDFNLHFFVCTPTVYYSSSLGQAKL